MKVDQAKNQSREAASSHLDDLLTSFFRSEMPQPWPSFAEPASGSLVATHSRSRSLFRSRLALAASVTLLLIGSWWLSQRLSAPEPGMAPSQAGKVIGAKPLPEKSKPRFIR
jgi:hypothetical protein